METLPEVDESKETSSNGQPASPLPTTNDSFKPTLIGGSTSTSASPNSVKANHTYVQQGQQSSPPNSNINNVAMEQLHITSKTANDKSINTNGVVSNSNKIIETFNLTTTTINTTSTSDNSNIVNNFNNKINTENLDNLEIASSTPLLAENSTNSNTNDYSGSERDALIKKGNNLD